MGTRIMKIRIAMIVASLTIALLNGTAVTADPQTQRTVHWPSFRGPNASGVAEGVAPPVRFDVPAGRNVRWRTPIPGLAHSSPVVWGDRVFLTTALSGRDDDELRVGLYGDVRPVEDEAEHTFRVYCIDKRNGEILWHRDAYQGRPAIQRHPKGTHANPTPATDGRRVVAFFGSEGLYCYDMDGELLWSKDLGVLDAGYFQAPAAQWGFASSPILHDGKVIIQVDVQEDSFIAAIDADDGSLIWRTPRDDVPTWSTPTIVEHGDGQHKVVVNGWKHIGGFELPTGEPIWWLRGGGDIPVPTPVFSPEHELIFIANAHGGEAPLYAIRTDAHGDITPPRGRTESDGLAWAQMRNGAYMQTPIVLGDYVYSARDNGVLTCYHAQTGEMIYRERLGAGGIGFTASPVAADDHLYFASEDGQVFVVPAGPEFEIVAENDVGEICMATPAISDDLLLIRTTRHLIAIGSP